MTSFQAFTRIASVVVLTGSVFLAFSSVLKEHLFKSKKVITYIDNVRLFFAETDAEYDLEVEVSSNASEQKDMLMAVNRRELAGSIRSRKTKGKRTRRSCSCSDQYRG